MVCTMHLIKIIQKGVSILDMSQCFGLTLTPNSNAITKLFSYYTIPQKLGVLYVKMWMVYYVTHSIKKLYNIHKTPKSDFTKTLHVV